MATDYVEMMENGSSAGENKAPTKTVHAIGYESVKPKRLTKKKNTASMKKRNQAETKKMAKGKKGKKKGGSKGGRKSAKRVAQGRKTAEYNRLRSQGMSKAMAKAKVWGDSSGVKKPKKKSKAKSTKSKTKSVSSAPRKSKGPARKSKKSKKRSGKSGSKSKGRKTSFRATTTRGATTINVRVPSAPAARRSKPRKSKGRKSKGKAKGKGGKKKSTAKRSPKGAMENPMTGVEIFVGSVTGLLGFGTADVVDRIIATHALTAATSGSTTTYTDTPPTASPAQGTAATYGSLYNATAVCAPMNVTRWLAGLGITAVPIVIANFISAPVGRSALQFFGFGAGMRIVGKGLIDMVASLTKSNATGMRLYGGEQRAAAIYANDGSATSLPAQSGTGLGRSLGGQPNRMLGHAGGCGCKACGNGKNAGASAPALAAKPATVGYPSYPAPVPQNQQVPTNTTTPPANTEQTVPPNVGIQGPPTGGGYVPRPGRSWNRQAA
jgi:hypothetical protein